MFFSNFSNADKLVCLSILLVLMNAMESSLILLPTDVLASFRAALDILSRPAEFNDLDSAIIASVDAFGNTEVSILNKYRAASCLCERDLRQVTQILILRSSNVVSTAVRLLLIMRGLPGNDELAYTLLSPLSEDELASLDSLTLALVALLCESFVTANFPTPELLSRASSKGDVAAELALAIKHNVQPPKKEGLVSPLQNWDSEMGYATSPSLWRELEWAAFARSHCVAAGLTSPLFPVSTSLACDSENGWIKSLPSSFGMAAPRYIRICGILMVRRQVRLYTKPGKPATMMIDSVQEERGSNLFIVIPSIEPVLRNVAIAIAHGLPFVLEGPTGCGKTALLTLLARATAESHSLGEVPGVTFIQMDSVMSDGEGESVDDLIGCVVPLPEGGGFRWRPGPIGLAVERGEWIVLENVGKGSTSSATMALVHRLAMLRVGHTIEAPGRGEPIRVASGFRCIATHTINTSVDNDWKPPGGWDLWLRIKMQELSNDDIRKILEERYPRVADCLERVVDTVSQVASYCSQFNSPIFVRPNMRQMLRICNRLSQLRDSDSGFTAETTLQETLDTLVAWCSDEYHVSKLVKLISTIWSMNSTAGDHLFSCYSPSFSEDQGTLIIGRAHCNRSLARNGSSGPSLALNSHTLRLLERLLRCVQLEENVLLTGEAGSGKTALVQELAESLGKKLVVVNLSRQSELSDLVGGFRPEEISAVIPRLARNFEELFCSCLSKEKNARFLEGLQRATRVPKLHPRALRLMRGALNALPKQLRSTSEEVLQEWTSISSEVNRLEQILRFSHTLQKTQMTKQGALETDESERPRKRPRGRQITDATNKRRVLFRFNEGVLVQAMRAGHWILLDEINLAPSDLLERLVSVVDKGEILLSNENAEVVNQAPGFMFFGSMNPPTDAWKRPLPGVLRARFSEFHVGDLQDHKDVIMLVLYRFYGKIKPRNQEEREIAEDVAHFFMQCCSLSKQGRIEDTSGKPVRFSVRNLTRMLDFARGSSMRLNPDYRIIRWALYEGAVVAFVTSLPRSSKDVVLRLSFKHVLRASKLFDKKRPPLSSHYTNIDWKGFIHSMEKKLLNRGALEPENINTSERKFVISPSVKKTMTDVCRAMLEGAPKFPILLQGPTAAGKTSIVSYLATTTGTELVRINNHEHTELSEYIGGYVVTEDGSLQFSEGPLVRAARSGYWILLDELNLAPPDVLESLNRLLDDNREVFIAETGEVVKAAPGFRLFATQNPPGLYGGRKELSRAFRSRFVEIHVDELPDEDLLIILMKIALIPKSFAKGMISVMRELQIRRRSTGVFVGREGYVTARDLFRWASRQPRSREELAIHGFFLLGERARTKFEREVVRNTLVSKLGISQSVLSDGYLYSLEFSPQESASQDCLDLSLAKLHVSKERLLETMNEYEIVLTPHTCRMIVLLLHCMANKEPSLLIGPTGSGKTTCCAVVCAALQKALITVNCHRHTETSDIVGGFRPVRKPLAGRSLFEWCNGPLVEAMLNGSAFLIDEINMADDAVIERLNSVLEPERSLLLSEKGTVSADRTQYSRPDTIKAHPGFVAFATMNPGGDFGKRELSPALRNRFTETWMPEPSTLSDYIPIMDHYFLKMNHSSSLVVGNSVRGIMVGFLSAIISGDHSVEDIPIDFPRITLRDLSAWCDFIVKASSKFCVAPIMAILHGARLVFLDGLSVGALGGRQSGAEQKWWDRLVGCIPENLRSDAERVKYSGTFPVSIKWSQSELDQWCLEVDGFRLWRNMQPSGRQMHFSSSFSFTASNTTRNIARLLRAFSIGQQPILLEGPPGGGKTSLISALADKSGFEFVRVNLSESTEMSDLIGSDAPAEVHGTFSFHPGPLLSALQRGAWVLIDELNLASQSVLEGLNSVLDHRRSLFVPELNKEFTAHDSFRIFGAQNPAADGNGRRGLPRSFLNRFAKVWVEPPDMNDVLSIISSLYPRIPNQIAQQIVEVLIHIKARLDSGLLPGTYGLRDALRWCDLLSKIGPFRSSFVGGIPTDDCVAMYMDHCFDVIVLQGLRLHEHRTVAITVFEDTFLHRWHLSGKNPSIFGTSGGGIRIGISLLRPVGQFQSFGNLEPCDLLMLSARLRELQALSLSLKLGWSTVLHSDALTSGQLEGKRLFKILGTMLGKKIRIIHGGSLLSSDDVVGGFCQQDVLWLIRRIHNEWTIILREMIVTAVSGGFVSDNASFLWTITSVQKVLKLNGRLECLTEEQLLSFAKDYLRSSESAATIVLTRQSVKTVSNLRRLQTYQSQLKDIITAADVGKFAAFEWRKSALFSAIEKGEWIFVENANQSSPAVLDRLNPLFESLPGSPELFMDKEDFSDQKKMLLAEAPIRKDGSPVYLYPHPDFRMVFSVSSASKQGSNLGLSRALLDRSLCIHVGDFTNEEQLLSFSSVGFSNMISKRSISKSSSASQTDPYQRAMRARLSLCVPGSDCLNGLLSADYNILCHTLDENFEQYVRGSSYTARTTPFSLSFNPEFALLERDIYALKELSSLSTSVVTDVINSTWSSRKVTISKVGRYDRSAAGFEFCFRAAVLAASAHLLLLSAMSLTDIRLRVSSLEHFLKHIGPFFSQDAGQELNEFAKFVLDYNLSLSDKSVSRISELHGIPIDPLYAFDASAVSILDCNTENSDLLQLQVRGKQFRILILVFANLRLAWDAAMKTVPCVNKSITLFAQAKEAMEISKEYAFSHDCDVPNYVILCFEIVQTVVNSFELILKVIAETPGWFSETEEAWLFFLQRTEAICKALIRERTPLTVLPSLSKWIASFRGLEIPRLHDLPKLSHLKHKAGVLLEAVNCSLSMIEVLAVPKTKAGHLLEEKLYSSICTLKESKVQFSEIDAAAQAIISTRSDDVESSDVLMATIAKLDVSLSSYSNNDSSLWTQLDGTDHWVQVLHSTIMSRLWRLLFTHMGEDKNLADAAERDRLPSLAFQVKCIPSLRFHTVLATQRLYWISDRQGSFSATGVQERFNFMKPYISCVLQEWHCKQSIGGGAHNQLASLGIMQSLMWTACYVSKCQFWSLGKTWQQSRATFSLVACGSVISSDTNRMSRKFILQVLTLLLSDLKMFSKTECNKLLDSMNQDEEFMLSSLIVKLNVLLESGGIRCSLICSMLRLTARVLQTERELMQNRKAIWDHSSRRKINHALLWILSGLLRIKEHENFVRDLMGLDPSDIAYSFFTSSAESAVKVSATRFAYRVVGDYRFGNDCVSESVPSSRLNKIQDEEKKLCEQAYYRLVERPSNKCSFESYCISVSNMASTLTRVAQENDLLYKIMDRIEPSSLETMQNQIFMLETSCKSVLESFECKGSKSHFRDISVNFELGLSKCLYGFRLLQYELGRRVVSSDEQLCQKLDLFRMLLWFPQNAVNDFNGCNFIFRKCNEVVPNGTFLISCADYLTNVLLRDGISRINNLCEVLGVIFQAWKSSLLLNEEETKRKSSLHILRDAINIDLVDVSHIVETVDGSEDIDFNDTFNPVSAEVEESMFGFANRPDTVLKLSTVNDPIPNDVDFCKLDAEAFWCLHRQIFPSESTSLGLPSTVSCLNSMTSVASKMHTFFSDVLLDAETHSNIWNSVLAYEIWRQFSGRPDTDRYNFYKSSNLPELINASSALRVLHESIVKLERNFFQETGQHPVLAELSETIQRVVKTCKADSPLSVVVVGIESVLRKADEWHRLFATQSMRLDRDVEKLSKLVMKWRRLEMDSWPFLLHERHARFETRASKWFFLLYDIVINTSTAEGNKRESLRRESLKLVDQFLRSSPSGEFSCRVNMVLSLSKHLSFLMAIDEEGSEIARALCTVGRFYATYIPYVTESISKCEKPIFTKLEEFMGLVKWTATEDLGSAQNMPKGRDKHLEYIRLKAASEKTRRRLHKLCLEIDSVLRKPVYNYISESVSKIGYGNIDEGDSKKEGKIPIPFSEKILSSFQGLSEFFAAKERFEIHNLSSINNQCGLLSQAKQFGSRMGIIAKRLNEHDGIAFIRAAKDMSSVRVNLRQRVQELRSANTQNIQAKKRSLIELLRCLRQMGLSPFISSTSAFMSDLRFYFSTPSPTNCPEFDVVADELFVECLKQVRRLHETSDTRLRNTDISKDEASKAVSFCNELVAQAATERLVLRLCSDDLCRLQAESSTLESISDFQSEGPMINLLAMGQLEMLQNKIRRLKSIVEDFEVVHHMLGSADLLSKLPSTTALSETIQSDAEFLLRRQILNESVEDLKKIRESVAACVMAIRKVTESSDACLICDTALRKTSLLCSGLRQSFTKCSNELTSLLCLFQDRLREMSHLSSANIFALLLKPTIEFLEKKEDIHNENDSGDDVYFKSNNLFQKMVANGNDIIKHVLIATQHILSWAGLSNDDIRQANQSKDIDNDSEDEILKNSISSSHKMISSFQTTAKLSSLASLLSKNRDLVELFYDFHRSFERKEYCNVIDLQNTLGQFVHMFLNMIITPAIHRCARYHSQSLAFLRTLSSLFVGLFTEGYCRPADNSSNDLRGEDQFVSGTGFGDIGNGDISEAVDVSKDVEDEEQLLGLEGNQDEGDDRTDNNEIAGEEGFDMTSDFQGAMEDVPDMKQNENDPNNSENSEIEKQLSSDPGTGKNTIDEQLWNDSNNFADNEDSNDVNEDINGRQKSPELIAKDDDFGEQNTEKKKPENPSTDHQQTNDGEINDEETEDRLDIDKKDDQEYDEKSGRDKNFSEGNPLAEADEDQNEDKSDPQTNPSEIEDTTRDPDGPPENNNEEYADDVEKPDSSAEATNSKEGMVDNNVEQLTEEDGSGSDVNDEAMVGDQAICDSGQGDFSDDAEGSDAMADGLSDKMDLGHLSDSDIDSEKNADEEGGSLNADQNDSMEDPLDDSDQKDVTKISEDANEVTKSMDQVDGNPTTMQAGGSQQQAFAIDDRQDIGIDRGKDDLVPMNTPGLQASGQDDFSKESHEGSQPNTGFQTAENSDRPSKLRSLDANPLRAMPDDELVKRWEDILLGVAQAKTTEEQNNPKQNEKLSPDEMTQEWQIVEENGVNDRAALAPVTEDQHRPIELNDDKDDQLIDEGQELLNDNENNESNMPDKMSERRNRGFGENDSGDPRTTADIAEQDGEPQGEDNCEVRDHPARHAVLNRTDKEIKDVGKPGHGQNGHPEIQMHGEEDVMDTKPDEVIKNENIGDKGNDGGRKTITEILDENEASDLWRQLESKVRAEAGVLCEQLRLVLEATERSGLGGSFRSGKRLNMRKVIEFVASDFRKDKIWMRRVRAERRAYDVMVAIDDSASMSEGCAGTLALEAVALVISALSKLEVGRVAVTSFGTQTQIVRDFDQELPISADDGGALLRHFTFEQGETDVADLLQSLCETMGSNQNCGLGPGLRSSANSDQRFSLVFVISDGHVNQREEIRNRVRKLKDANVLVAFIILDGTYAEKHNRESNNAQSAQRSGKDIGPQERTSIFDVKRVNFDEKGNISVKPYMEDFPVPFYVVVHDVRELPHVIADALRHWIEVASR